MLARASAVLLVLAEAAWLLVAAEEGSCARRDAKGGCLRDPSQGSAGAEGTDEEPKMDLITQEVQELQEYIKLAKDRVMLLNKLKGFIAEDKNLSLPPSYVRALREEMPIVSSVVVDEDRAPTSSADDFVISKRIIRQPVASTLVDFLALRSPRSTTPSSTSQITQPSALLVVADPAGDVRLYTPTGELVREFPSGHSASLEHLSVSPSSDEYFVATADVEGSIRVHVVKVRPTRLSKEEKQERRSSTDEKVSQYLGPQSNVTVTFQRSMQVPENDVGTQPRLTSFVAASQKGTKYFVAGDDDGKISVFTRNGTFLSKIDAVLGHGAVEGLHAQASSVVFRAGAEWGFVNLERQDVTRIECPRFEGHTVSDSIVDSQQATRALVADEEGTVWAFNLKNRSACRVEHRFPRGALRPPVRLASVRGYALALERPASGPAGLVALNMSRVGKGKSVLQQPPVSNVVWRKERAPVASWVVHKRLQQGDLIALLSEDGLSVEVMELLMTTYTPPPQDSFGNLKVPVIAVAIVLVLGYQYIKQKNKMGGSSSRHKFDDFDFSKDRKSRLGGSGLGSGLGSKSKGLGAKSTTK